MLRRISGMVGRVTSQSRLEWLVVASILALLALALLMGWIHIEVPRP